MKYEFLDLTSDVMFRAYGAHEKELFINAATAMFSVICEIDEVRSKKRVEIKVSAENLEMLLYEWLSTLLTQAEIEEMFFSEFHIDGIRNHEDMLKLEGWAMGEAASAEKRGTLVKGVTYYELKIVEIKAGMAATVSLDI